MEFIERVRNSIILGASVYKAVFVDYDYLIYSSAFKNEPYYIICAQEDNYAHLTGVHTMIPAKEFFNKCMNNTLQIGDFDFLSKYKSEKEVKGSVRRKIQMLPLMSTLFERNLWAEEDFTKGSVHCSLGTTDNTLTIGFVNNTRLRPKTLLKSNVLDPSKTVDITLVLRRNRGTDKFDTVIQSDVQRFSNCYPDIVKTELLCYDANIK